MATTKGIIGFQGTIGGITFYRRKGKQCARIAGDPSKEKIATSEKCQRTRENNAEFRGAVAASKFVRQGLSLFMKDFADWNVSGRLNGVFKKMIDRSNGIRGERSFHIVFNKKMLVGFNLNKEVSFDSIFHAPFNWTSNTLRNEVVVSVPAFDVYRCINAPLGATHFRLVNAITIVPGLNYDPVTKEYFRADGEMIVYQSHVYSAYISINDNYSSDVSLKASFVGNPIISAGTGVVSCLGIQFYQEVNSEMNSFQSGCCMKIYEVF